VEWEGRGGENNQTSVGTLYIEMLLRERTTVMSLTILINLDEAFGRPTQHNLSCRHGSVWSKIGRAE
jgi:hypothetical protein